MKQIVFSLMVIGFALSCSKKEQPNSAAETFTETSAPAAAPVVADPVAEGKSLIEGADCLSCHKVDEKMIGPSYKEVAAKYENTPENVEMLADKIIKGSSGVWGDVPMPPHGFSKENAKFMAQYVLSLK